MCLSVPVLSGSPWDETILSGHLGGPEKGLVTNGEYIKRAAQRLLSAMFSVCMLYFEKNFEMKILYDLPFVGI